MLNRPMIGLTLSVMILLIGSMYMYWQSPTPCHPAEMKAKLATLSSKGIHAVRHPPSQSNLLWVHVGPRWHTLSLKEKQSLDRIVRCAARTTDDQGQPAWRAAYYDRDTGKLVALTSRKWGFRLETQETHFSQDFISP